MRKIASKLYKFFKLLLTIIFIVGSWYIAFNYALYVMGAIILFALYVFYSAIKAVKYADENLIDLLKINLDDAMPIFRWNPIANLILRAIIEKTEVTKQTKTISRDCLSVFNLAPDYTNSDLKKAYFKLAKKYHPDTTELEPELANKRFQLLLSCKEKLTRKK